MVRTALFSIAVASTFIVAAVAHPFDSYSQEDNFEREFVRSIDDLDLASRADMDVDLLEREPIPAGIFSMIGQGIGAITKAIAARKARKAAQKAAGGAPPPRQKGKREFLDEDTEDLDLFQREVVEEFIRSYLEDNLESIFDRRDLVESLDALD
ncbi:hypothetical protein EST38_g7326 [Candolleomyces aberdarensis]|uniref:Uncharacterized protein n=1 Tax=Candolleomyces aberdarensis TaxID=2316362 RepID=A0A4Q2DHF0_9AGAR|nr:hypothetical protein EST38_g7326 [Candolleomyces aberdarensis]